LIEGTHPTKRYAGKINFWVVHVVAQVAARATGGSHPSHCVMANAWQHRTVRFSSASVGSP